MQLHSPGWFQQHSAAVFHLQLLLLLLLLLLLQLLQLVHSSAQALSWL
jgi:hypothetical protein